MRSLEFPSIALNESKSYGEATSRTILVEHASPGGSNGDGTVLDGENLLNHAAWPL